MDSFQQTLESTRRSYLKGSPVETRQHLDRAMETVHALIAHPSDETLALLAMAIETDVMLTDFVNARRGIDLALVLIQGLPRSSRDDARLQIQTLQLLTALKEGDLSGAAEMWIASFRPSRLEASTPALACGFARVAVEALREFGLLDVALDVLDWVEQRVIPRCESDGVESRLGLHQLRVSIALHGLGQPLRSLGPLGWSEVRAERARGILDTAIRALPGEIGRATDLGMASHAMMATLLLEAAQTVGENTSQRARRIESTRERLRFQRESGFLCDVVTVELELAGLLLAEEKVQQAMEVLRGARTTIRGSRYRRRAEEWYWHMHRAQQELGRPLLALIAFKRYAGLADQRRQLALRLQVAAQPSLAELLAHSPDDPDLHSLVERLHHVGRTASSVEALAAGLNLSARRLQQVLKARGLPPPSAYIQSPRAFLPTGPAGVAETNWDRPSR